MIRKLITHIDILCELGFVLSLFFYFLLIFILVQVPCLIAQNMVEEKGRKSGFSYACFITFTDGKKVFFDVLELNEIKWFTYKKEKEMK